MDPQRYAGMTGPAALPADVHRMIFHEHARIFGKVIAMGAAKSQIVHKHFRLDASKLKRAQKLLKASTETETVERALDLAILEYERDRLTVAANEKFVKAGIDIRDVFAALEL